MLVHIQQVLTPEEVRRARQVLADAPWSDGRRTAGEQSAQAKNNQQLPESWEATQQLQQLVLAGLARHAPALEVVQSAAGMHVVAWLPGWTTARFDALIATAAERGLGLHPIHPHYVRPPHWPGLLLGFAGLSVSQLRAATALLGQCLAAVPTFD